MENAIIVLLIVLSVSSLWRCIKTTQTPFVAKEHEHVPTIYDRLLAEGYVLSEAIVKSRKISMEAIVSACDALDEWDQKVYRLTKLTLVKG